MRSRCRTASGPSGELPAPQPPSGPRPRGQSRAASTLARLPELERHRRDTGTALRHDLARRHAGPGHVALGGREGARRRRRSTRSASSFIEAGFPSSNPKEAELFELLADDRARAGDDLRLRHDPPPRASRPRTTRRCATWSAASRRSSPSSARPGRLHLEKVTKVSPRGEPGDDRRLGRLLPRAEGKRVVYDAEHFFDGCRDDPGYALDCLRAAAEAGAENVTLCDTNGSSLPRPGRRGDRRRRRRARRAASRSASTPTTTPSAGSPTRSPPSTPARAWSRARSTATASAAATPTWSRSCPRCSSSWATSACPRTAAALTETAHFVDELCNMTPDPDQPYVGRNAFAHKGGMHAAGVAGRRPHLRAPRPGAGRQQPRDPDLRALRQGIGLVARRAGRHRARRRRGDARGRAAQGARAPRLPLRGRATPPSSCCCGARRAPTSRCSSSRASGSITEKRADGTGRDRGDDQGLGRRRALRAHGRGQRPGQRARQGAARRDHRAHHPHLADDRADQLQGPDPRRAPRHRRGHPGPARLLRRRATSGGRSASRRTSSRPPGRRSSTRSSTPSSRRPRPGHGERSRQRSRSRGPRSASARRSSCSRCCARPALAGPDAGALRARASPTGSGSTDAVAVSSGTAALHLGVRALGWGAGRRGPDQPVQLRRLGQLPALRGRDARSSATSTR